MTATAQPNASRTKRIAAATAIATALAVPAEGIRRVAYYDPPGVLSVCMGSTTDVDPNHVYSLDECWARLDKDMQAAVTAVDECIPDLPEQALAALGDAAYNLGSKIVCNASASTLARKAKAMDWSGMCNELPRWDKASVGGYMVALPGLTKRRALERNLCLEGFRFSGDLIGWSQR